MFFSKPFQVALVVSVTALDLFLTLYCQHDEYWENYSTCTERNPIGYFVLCHGPECWVALSCLWVLVVLWAVIWLPGFISTPVIVAALVGHGWGLSTWLHHVLPHIETYQWFLHMLYYGIILCIIIGAARGAFTKKPSSL